MVPSLVQKLLESEKYIYVAASLFSPWARLAAANLAGTVEAEIHRRIHDAKVDSHRDRYVFLPYRDTEQRLIIGPDRSQRIFAADVNELNRSVALLARLDGLAKDAGVAMEIGYAFGKGTPIAILVTDFIGEDFIGERQPWFVDPMIAKMATVLHTAPHAYPIPQSYFQTNLLHEHFAVSQFASDCLNKLSPPESVPKIPEQRARPLKVYVDICGAKYEWSRIQQEKIADALIRMGYEVQVSRRFSRTSDVDTLAVVCENELASLEAADAIVISGDMQEIDQGSAALFGLALAWNKIRVLIYTSSTCYSGSGGQVMRGNLMIECAATRVASSIAEMLRGFETCYAT